MISKMLDIPAVIPKQLLQEIIAAKIENNIYLPAKAAQVIDNLQN